MLRSTARPTRHLCSIPPPTAKTSGGRVLMYMGLGTVGGVSLTLAACDHSKVARQAVETQVPQLTPFLQSLMGAHGSRTLSKRIGIVSEKEQAPLPRASSQETSPRVISTESKRPTKPEAKTPKATVAAAIDRSKDKETEREIRLEDSQIAALNSSFETRLAGSLTAAEKALAAALSAEESLGEAILKQSQAVKAAVDKADATMWDLVGESNLALSEAQKVEHQARADASNYMDMLRQVLNDARSHSATARNAHIDNAQTTLGQFVVQLETAASKVRRAETEAKVTSEYRRLIEESRRQFADELQTVLPNAAVVSEADELSEQQLNALVAHAHVKVDMLKRELVEQQLREEQHIVEALARQTAEQERQFDELTAAEIHRQQERQERALEIRLSDARRQFEEDLRNQLRRSAAAHSAHLEDVLRVHTEQMEAEATRRVQVAVSAEREEFHAVMSTSLQRLHTIEEALNSRAAQDAENRRAKELWLACQNLVESVVHGRKGGATEEQRRQPLANQLICIKESSRNDAAVATLFDAFNEQSIKEGVYTEDDLCTRFERVRRVCSRVALVDESNASLWTLGVSAVQSMLIVQRASSKPYPVDERVDLCAAPDTHAVFDRASYHLKERHDLLTAVRLLSLLEGEPARLARSWLTDARAHLEARQTAQLLLAHAAAQSLRTVY